MLIRRWVFGTWFATVPVGFASAVGSALGCGVLVCSLASADTPAAAIATGEAAAESAADSDRVSEQQRLRDALEPFVEDDQVSGAVVAIVGPDGLLVDSAIGMASLESGRPMRSDTLFWIASMTKPITAVSVLILQDEGKLSLDDAVAKHLPEFAELKDSAGKPVSITIAQLLSHTSGMADLPSPAGYRFRNLEDAVKEYVTLPVNFEPGTRWQYCQSSINTAARIVEVVSGLTFDQFLNQRVFQPLGMDDTTFYLNDEQLSRIAMTYRRDGEGKLTETDLPILCGKSPTDRRRMPAANGGLFSTVKDYGRFCQMLLRDGEFGGVQLLSPDAVKQLSTVITGDLATGFTPGNGWGVGVCVVRQPQGVSKTLSPGSFGHGGMHGTQAWIDPVNKRATILLIARAGLENADDSPIRHAFQAAAAEISQSH